VEGSDGEDELDLCEEEGEEVVCVVKRLLCSTMQPEETQRKKILESKCTVNGKVCKLVIDSCSCENLVYENLVNHLNLETQDHPHWLAQERSKTMNHKAMQLTPFLG